ncbi:PREDICTED: very-long-chain (3R)-3-hydroxyacyl-CoA dehydratase 1 [Ceratotherium simum simum]|uniref:Very-long-chain (3R)-3-hydroxyacyl-CoA dehydratase n=1 Tax=Ceratotherium simum simum TaxID=73337 RepID=A0ABM1CHH8_CERSS|nr:PREDICTED: very-long-chain (3R)-3-hydroxyacyl-CoA dehydratase 1 [Ceratotherium simum simum]
MGSLFLPFGALSDRFLCMGMTPYPGAPGLVSLWPSSGCPPPVAGLRLQDNGLTRPNKQLAFGSEHFSFFFFCFSTDTFEPICVKCLVLGQVRDRRWLVLAIAMVRFYMEKGTHKGLYKSVQKTLKFFQTFALLEIVHCLIGIVPTSVIVAGVQVSSRIFMVWLVTHSIKPIQNEESVVLFLVSWTVTEITRYSFYTFSLLDHLPYFIKWARYNFFIILYPVGVAGELLTIYAALPYVKKTGMFSIRLPNKYNISFDYYYFLLITMASYIPLFPQLYFHMLRQRRKVLHGEVIVEKDD